MRQFQTMSKTMVYCVNFRTKKITGGGDFITKTPFLFTNKDNVGWNSLTKFAKIVGLTLEGKKSVHTLMEEVLNDSRDRIIPEIEAKGSLKLKDPEKFYMTLRE